MPACAADPLARIHMAPATIAKSAARGAVAARRETAVNIAAAFCTAPFWEERAMNEILMAWDVVNVLALFVLLLAFLWIIAAKWLR